MKVVILCGGKGTRLREETEYRPKPMVPIGGTPILWHIMKNYANQGLTEFILCLGYKGEVIKEFFRNYMWNRSDVTLSLGKKSKLVFHDNHGEDDWTVTLADTGEESMTACRVKQVQKYIPDGEPFMLTYGDGLADIDLNKLVSFHHEQGKLWTITAVCPASRFGAVKFDKSGEILAFEEKSDVGAEYVNGGFMLCDYKVFDYLPDAPTVMLEQEPMKRAVSEKELSCYRHNGFWQCMDTYREYQYLNELWNSGNPPWKNW